jgi:hypothetical protein
MNRKNLAKNGVGVEYVWTDRKDWRTRGIHARGVRVRLVDLGPFDHRSHPAPEPIMIDGVEDRYALRCHASRFVAVRDADHPERAPALVRIEDLRMTWYEWEAVTAGADVSDEEMRRFRDEPAVTLDAARQASRAWGASLFADLGRVGGDGSVHLSADQVLALVERMERAGESDG